MVGLEGCIAGWEGRADGDAVEEAGICGGNVAPVEAQSLEGRVIGNVAPIFQHGIVGEDADVGTVEAPDEHVGWRVAMVEGYGADDFHWEGELSDDERPVDGVDEGAIGRDPASDDVRIPLVADD